MNYDYSPLFYERSLTSTGCCRICLQPRTENGEEAHAAIHLARCEAVTITENGITKVVPTTDVPWNPKDGPAPDDDAMRNMTPDEWARFNAVVSKYNRKLDPKLAKIVAMAQAKDKQARRKA